jgi:hypothetical protein
MKAEVSVGQWFRELHPYTGKVLIKVLSLPYTQTGQDMASVDVETHLLTPESHGDVTTEKLSWYMHYLMDNKMYRVATHRDLLMFISRLFI